MIILQTNNNGVYVECDIAPLNSVDTPINYYSLNPSPSNSWATSCYNSAVWISHPSYYYINFFFIFDSAPSYFKINGTNFPNEVKYDSVTGYYAAYSGQSTWTATTSCSVYNDIPVFWRNDSGTTAPQDFIDYVTTVIVNYHWSSVPAISGKNGILSLTTLKEESINDGSPVDDATASAFNNAPDSCSVGGIVSKDLPIIEGDPTSVALKYNIPELTDSTYTVCKVVAKKDKIPKSKTDGNKIIDISPTSGGIVVSGLDENTKYYFVIFTEDSVGNSADSEPKSIKTGEKPKKWKETISYLKMITG